MHIVVRGGKDLTGLPYEWRSIVDEVLGMYLRAEFGIQISDEKLTDRQKMAIESFQSELNKLRKNNTS